MESRPTIDASVLPASVYDTRAPVWWGNALLLAAETVALCLVVASYFYLRNNEQQWPPPQVNTASAIKHPVPDLAAGTLNTLLLVMSCAPMYWVDQAARRHRGGIVKRGLVMLGALGTIMVAIRLYEFPGLNVSWDDNAYASTVWLLLGLHTLYLIAIVVEAAVVCVWAFMHGLDEKHSVDVTLTAATWYWTASVWLLLYAVIYWAPRWL